MIIYEENNKNFRLKEIEQADIEDLRVWKNKNKQYFFLKKDITPEGQQYWFDNIYLKNADNYMYVVQENDGNNFVNVGCMGYRLKDGVVDVYNIMRGREFESENSMAKAFNMMNFYIAQKHNEDITCVVLKDNPARNWYEKNHLVADSEVDDHVEYKLNKEKLPQFKLEIK